MDEAPALQEPPKISSMRLSVGELNDYIELNQHRIFYGELDVEHFHGLCVDLVLAIERCIGPSDINLKEDIYSIFLQNILPKAIDIFLKRRTLRSVWSSLSSHSLLIIDRLREHVGDVRKVLIATARLLAQPVSQEISRLCELRNHLLTASSSWKFYSPDGIFGDRSHMLGGFFADYGQPETVILVRPPSILPPLTSRRTIATFTSGRGTMTE
jgi:hypothetical protein